MYSGSQLSPAIQYVYCVVICICECVLCMSMYTDLHVYCKYVFKLCLNWELGQNKPVGYVLETSTEN
jgi:hypothetical protein